MKEYELNNTKMMGGGGVKPPLRIKLLLQPLLYYKDITGRKKMGQGHFDIELK